MNLFSRKLNALLIVAILMCLTVFTATAQTITSNQTGNQGGYFYTFWTDGGGSVSMTLGSGGQYSVQWSNCGNFVVGKGWNPGGSRTITWSGSASGAQYFGVYGWLQNPLIEYYIPRSGGSSAGTYKVGGTTWTLNTAQRVNQPSIEGTATFTQFFCSGGGQPIDMAGHIAGWKSLGKTVGNHNYQVVAVEGWGGSSGSANVTVGGGSASTTTSSYSTTSASGSTTTSTTGTGNITVRARGTKGGEKLEIRVNGSAVASFNMTTSYANYSANGSGTVQVAFTNDDGQSDGMDIQVDYVIINGTTYQAENQATNTGVWQNDSCGGSNSEWLHCNGYIEFGSGSATPVPGTTTTSSGGSTTSSGTTTSSSSSSGSTCSPATSKSVPFTQDGAGEYCFSTSSNINYINSWNMATLTVNGVNFANKWASGSSLPSKIDGKYYIVYKGNYGWSHFEAR
ncbi:MAG: glycoside hydrolase family 11 protein [Spirochaetales bacterium]|nr:glycoside hydrolase family 11 protein [Spirochaetales bacterium]